MKKFVFIVFIIILLLPVFMACDSSKGVSVSKLEISRYNISEQSPDVEMSVKESNITGSVEKVNLIFTNHSDKEYTYGIEPILEMEVESTWYVKPMLDNAAWISIGYILLPNDTLEDSFDIKNYYGELTTRLCSRVFFTCSYAILSVNNSGVSSISGDLVNE